MKNEFDYINSWLGCVPVFIHVCFVIFHELINKRIREQASPGFKSKKPSYLNLKKEKSDEHR